MKKELVRGRMDGWMRRMIKVGKKVRSQYRILGCIWLNDTFPWTEKTNVGNGMYLIEQVNKIKEWDTEEDALRVWKKWETE